MSSCERFKTRKTRVSSNLQHKRPKSRKSKVPYPGCKFSDNILDSRSGTRPSSKRGRRPRNKGNSKHHIKEISLFQGNSVRQCFNPVRQILDQDDYISSDGQIYAVGETAYIQSDTISTPYFIGQILDFKTTRKDEILAEIQWYYRPSEVPASVLDSLVQDRCLQADNLEETISHSLIDKQVRSRELFRSGLNSNVDCCNITSVSLFRGKCNVLPLSEILDLKDFTKKDDNFFCILGFDPITRRLSDFKGEIRIGASHQATLPLASKTSNLSDAVIESQIWSPNMIEDSELQMYLKATRSISMHSGWCLRGRIDDGILAMQSDRLTQNSYDLLFFDNYCTKTSLRHILQKPNAFDIIYEKSWTQDEAKSFYKGIRKVGKNFNKIRDEFLPEKSVCELVYYYYHWKRSTVGLASRSQRKTRKALHLKKNRNDCSNPHLSLHDLFIEMCSADELEEDESILNAELTEIDPIVQSKDTKNRICQHCYSSGSQAWHHGGMDNLLLCDVCRIFYCKYAQMPKMPNIADLPLHILRDITNKDLILKINEDRFLMDDISAKSTREISESSDYSDSDSFLSDNERQIIEFKKSDSLNKVPLLYENQKKQEVINNYQPDSYLQLITNQPSDVHIKQIPDLDFIKQDEMTDFSLQNRGSILSSKLNKDNYLDFINHREDIHFKNSVSPVSQDCEDCANRCILKSLLQSTVEKSPLNSSDIHVIVHDQDGFKVSTTSYVDNCVDDSTIESLSESPSPTLKRDFVLFSSEPRQGAARLDFQPKPNISDLINNRPQNVESSLVSTRSKDSSTNTTNVSMVAPHIAAISHVSDSYFNTYTSKIPIQLIDSNCQQSKTCYNSSIADKCIPKASISSQSLSHIGYSSVETDSGLSYSNPIVHNFILPPSSKCKPSSAEAKASIPTVISASEIESRELSQTSTTNMTSSNTLQPQIPTSTQMFESPMIGHNFTSDNSCAKSNQSVPNVLLSSKTTHTPSVINLSNMNSLPTIISNNMLVNQVHETNVPPHYLNFAPTNDKFTVDISNIEHDKNIYQNYLNLLQNQLYSNQMNTYFLSQIPPLSHSNQQLQAPYHGQLFHPQVNSQMSHIVPPQFFQSQTIHSSQSPTKPTISGILPIPNDILQLSSLPFRVSSEQLLNSDLNENTK